MYQSMPSEADSMCAESISFPLNPSLFKDSRNWAIETDSSGVEFAGWIIYLFIGHGFEGVKRCRHCYHSPRLSCSS